jgi:hypothetical protein
MQPTPLVGVLPDTPPGNDHHFAIARTDATGAVVDRTDGCVASGCHPSADNAAALMDALQTEIQSALDGIAARLGPPTTWQYAQMGGPTDQSTITDAVKQVRFLYSYVTADKSLGVHNPGYARQIISQANAILTSIGE